MRRGARRACAPTRKGVRGHFADAAQAGLRLAGRVCSRGARAGPWRGGILGVRRGDCACVFVYARRFRGGRGRGVFTSTRTRVRGRRSVELLELAHAVEREEGFDVAVPRNSSGRGRGRAVGSRPGRGGRRARSVESVGERGQRRVEEPQDGRAQIDWRGCGGRGRLLRWTRRGTGARAGKRDEAGGGMRVGERPE